MKFYQIILIINSLFGIAISADELSSITKIYRAQPQVEIEVQKKNLMKWTMKEHLSRGKIFYSQGKIRWEIATPEKIWSIYDGEKMWVVQFASPDFPGKNKVTRAKISKKNKDQIFIINLLQMKNLNDEFKIQVEKQDGTEVLYKLEPKGKEATLFDVRLRIDTKKKRILEISYKDDIENETRIIMGTTNFMKKNNPDLYSYKPTKQDEVTDL